MLADFTRLIRQHYYAAVSYADDLVGSILAEVDFGSTVVALIGDHGWSLGEHGEFAKFSNFESATRVPLVIFDPRNRRRQVL